MAKPTIAQVEKALIGVYERLFAIVAGSESTEEERQDLLRRTNKGAALLGEEAATGVLTRAAKAWQEKRGQCALCGAKPSCDPEMPPF